MWSGGKGKVEHIMVNGSLGTGKFRIKATKDNPAFLLRIYQGNEPTAMLTGKSASDLKPMSGKISLNRKAK